MLARPCPYCGGSVEPTVAPDSRESVKAKCSQCGNIVFGQSSSELFGAQEGDDDRAGGKTAKELAIEAGKLYRDGRYEAAVIKLRAAADKVPESMAILLSLGQACTKANLGYDALAAYRKVLDAHPENEEALFKAAMVLIGQKRFSHGLGLLNKLVELNPSAEQAKLMISLAKARLKENQLAPTAHARVESRSKRPGRLYDLYKLVKSPTISTLIYTSLFAILPLLFSVAYWVESSFAKNIDPILAAILIYNLFMGVVLHELGHGVAAFLSGDDTAFRAGRLTMNPIRHISFLGTVIVPAAVYSLTGVTFGWAKPVPFNPINLERQPRDQAVVAGAGPFVSFALSYLMFVGFVSLAAIHNSFYPGSAIYFSLDLVIPMEVGEGFYAPAWFVALETLAIGCVVNLILGVFNLIPVPPLDGSWLLKAAAPPGFSAFIDRFKWVGLAMIIGAVYSGWILYLFYPAFIILSGYNFLAGVIL